MAVQGIMQLDARSLFDGRQPIAHVWFASGRKFCVARGVSLHLSEPSQAQAAATARRQLRRTTMSRINLLMTLRGLVHGALAPLMRQRIPRKTIQEAPRQGMKPTPQEGKPEHLGDMRLLGNVARTSCRLNKRIGNPYPSLSS